MSEPGTNHEVEAKLIVLGPERAALLERCATGPGLTAGAPELRLQELHDRYFDLAGDPLRARDSGLRLREVDGATRLTFKGPADVRDLGLVDRLELEGEWSQRALTRVLDHLATVGVHLPPATPCDAPLTTLERLGFRLVQERRTRRRSTELSASAPEGGEPYAFELALDEVHYGVGDHTVLHREIEVEARTPASATALPLVLHNLLAYLTGLSLEQAIAEPFAHALHPWTWSKTALGAELERLDAERRLTGLVTGSELSDEGYAEVDARLRR